MPIPLSNTIALRAPVGRDGSPAVFTASKGEAGFPSRPTKKVRLNIWSAYRTGMRTKTGTNGSTRSVIGHIIKSVRTLKKLSWTLTPIDFLRYREFDFALKAISNLPTPRRALDLSSPKLLPLTIAAHLPETKCVSTDILQREVDWVAGKARQLSFTNLNASTLDARKMALPTDHFDLITSISVFEHIAPEHGGDLPAIREMARVLAPGGHALLTVPFSRNYLADYLKGDVYERQTDGEPIFFQRFYTEQLLVKNFVESAGLELASIGYIDEQYTPRDPRKRAAHVFNNSPRQTAVFGPVFPLLSHVFLSQPRPMHKCRKPYIACLVLRKPATTKHPARAAA